MEIIDSIKRLFTKNKEYVWVGPGENPLRHLGIKDMSEIKGK